MVASLRGRGTMPEVREEFMMSMMSGARVVKQSLTSLDGMGSRGEVDEFIVESILKRSAMVTGEKEESRWSEGEKSTGSETGVIAEEAASWLWMVSILELKKDMSLSHFSEVNEDEMLSWGLRSLFMVENRERGLEDPEWMMPE